MRTVLFFLVSLVFFSCGMTQVKEDPFPAGSGKKFKHEAVATFAEGCFWHSEIVFQSLQGVRDAVSGFSGGRGENPSYDEVCSGRTGYAEAVQVYYDPSKISYETLVKAFFASMDPTQLNRQGRDVGEQYRSVAFYRNQQEKKVIEDQIRQLSDSRKYTSPIVTEVQPFKKFYAAEDYHQEYVRNHPDNPYVQHVSVPDFVRFKSAFNGNFK